MSTSYLFKSARLGFRNWTDADIAPFAALNADPVVMEFFPNTRTYDETASLVDKFRHDFEQNGFCFFAVDQLDTGAFIGFIGLNKPSFDAYFMPCVEIGWRLIKSVWGQGFATEGAIRCLEYAFDELNLEEVYSFTALINKRSERIMQKAGMEKVGEFSHPVLEAHHPLAMHSLYRLARG
ncbi:MAG: GNAT family N-acetyltransferase [Chitinophagaceae bacterium]|nr:GNAT family N-acetyltransferase [Chitinophagaceae bacterium]